MGEWGNTLATNFLGNVNIGRIISSEKKFDIPISFSYAKNQSTPKYLTGKDILLESGSVPDSLMEREKVLSTTSSINFSFKKIVPSKHWLLANTIDKISFSYAGANSYQKDYNTKYNRGNTGSTNFTYTLDLPTEKLGLKPFSWLESETFLVGRLNGLNLKLLPKSFNFTSATSESKQSSLSYGSTEKSTKSLNFTRNFALGFMPINDFDVQLSRNYASDMREEKGKVSIFIGKFGKEASMGQDFNTSYQLRLFSWLTNRFNYRSAFALNNNIQLPEAGRTATNNTNRSADMTLDLANMFGFTKAKSSSGNTEKRSIRGRRPIVNAKEEEKKTEEEQKKEEKEEKPFFLWRGVGGIIMRINPVSFKYSNGANVNAVGLEEKPTLGYVFGFDHDPGVETLPTVGTSQGQVVLDNSINLGSGFNLTKNITSSFNYTKTDNQTERANTFTGSKSETYLLLGNKKIPFFNWNVTWNGLERLALISSLFRQVSITHAYTGTKNMQLQTVTQSTTNEQAYVPVTEDFSSGFKPLIGINFNWKNGISSNFTWGNGETISDNLKVSSSTRRTEESIQFKSNYSTIGGFNLPIPFISSRRVNNNLTASLTFSSTSNNVYNTNKEGEYIIYSGSKNWSLKPEITYNVSSKISGGLHFEIGKNEDLKTGKNSIKDFGLSIDIIIAGQ